MRNKTLSVAVLSFLLGSLIGVLAGPRVNVLYWAVLLDRHPNSFVKTKAAERLGESELGMRQLYGRLASPNNVVRMLSIEELATIQKPYYAANLLGKVPNASVKERLEIISRLDYGREHRFVLDTLRYEYAHTSDIRLKKQILAVQRSLEGAGSKDGAMSTKQSNSKAASSRRTPD